MCSLTHEVFTVYVTIICCLREVEVVLWANQSPGSGTRGTGKARVRDYLVL